MLRKFYCMIVATTGPLEMLNAFVSRFYQVFSPTTFSLMLIGIVVGDVIESMRKILAK